MSYKRNVGLVGGVSLLVTSITGPGIVLIPLVYQQSGWLMFVAVINPSPTLAFILIGILAGFASLFVVESVNRFPGNEDFERNVEFTVMVHQYFGRKVYYLFIFILYGSLQSVNIASIVGSAQIFDSLLVGIVGGTCGWGISPISGLYCVTEIQNTNSPFGNNSMFVTVGYLIVISTIIPLTNMDLNDNMFLQFVSLVYNFVYILTLIGSVAVKPPSQLLTLPVIGTNFSQVIGQVLFNFTLANTIPSWMNVKHSKVDHKKTVWYAIFLALGLYILTGIVGGVGYPLSTSTNLLQAMYADTSITSGAKGWITIIYILFPILTYLSSIPVAMIVVRLNFLAAKLCSPKQAHFWAVIAPFIIAIPMQTGDVVTYFGTYTSIIFQSTCNFFAPFLIFLFLSKRHLELAQSVIDELEFLDISAGIQKKIDLEDDNFDYVYHLPHADPSRIIHRDPIKSNSPSKSVKIVGSMATKLSNNSTHSIYDIRCMLNPSLPALSESLASSRRMSKTSRVPTPKPIEDNLSVSNNLKVTDFLRRTRSRMNSVTGGHEFKFTVEDIDDENNFVTVKDGGDLSFRALPDFIYKYVHPSYVAGIGFALMVLMILQVIVSVALDPSN